MMQVSFIRGLLIAIIIVVCCFGGKPAEAVSIKPAYLDLNVKPGQTYTGVITVANTSGNDERYRVSAAHFRLSREGELQQVDPDSFAVSNWIKFNPKEFSLAANGQQMIRYTLVPARDARVSDYWSILELTNLAPRMVTSDDASQEVNVKIAVSTAIVIPIFVQVGDVDYKWSLLNLKAEMGDVRPQVLITLSNTANGRVPFTTEIEILDGNGDVIAQQHRRELSLFPFSERVVTLPIEAELEPGEYTVRVRISSEKAQSSHAGETVLKILSKP